MKKVGVNSRVEILVDSDNSLVTNGDHLQMVKSTADSAGGNGTVKNISNVVLATDATGVTVSAW